MKEYVQYDCIMGGLRWAKQSICLEIIPVFDKIIALYKGVKPGRWILITFTLGQMYLLYPHICYASLFTHQTLFMKITVRNNGATQISMAMTPRQEGA